MKTSVVEERQSPSRPSSSSAWTCPTPGLDVSKEAQVTTKQESSSFEVERPPQSSTPDGGIRAWLTIAGSFCSLMGSFGVINSIGTFQSYLRNHQLHHFESRDVGWIAAFNIILCMMLGAHAGPLFDRHGPRWLLAGASFLWISGMVGMSFAHCSRFGDLCNAGIESTRTYAVLMVTWGLICGMAAAVLTTSSLAVVAHWFDTRRGLAVGIVYSGSSFGGVVYPLLLRHTLGSIGWAWSVRILALIVTALLMVANICIKGRNGELEGGTSTKRVKIVDYTCFSDMRFVWATLGVSLFEFTVTIMVGVVPTWAKAKGFDDATGLAVLSVYNSGSCVGRIVAGAVSDHVGRLNTTICTIFSAMAIVCALWVPVTKDRLVLFYVFAGTFGFCTGSIMSLAPVCISQLCKPGDFGRYLGTCYSVVSIFCFFSIPIGAEVVDKLGTRVFCLLFASFLSICMGAFIMCRLTCLNYHWKWSAVL